MQGGFSFCGTDIADLGLEYVPDNANTYVFAGSDYKVHDQVFDGHHGGYFYGSTVHPKVFTLRCIYEETNINDGVLTRVENFFRRGRSGRLVFKKRPWVYYVATVTGLDTSSITNYRNGIVTIQQKAYYPFGRCDELFYTEGSEYEANMTANSAMLPMSTAVPTQAIMNGEVMNTQSSWYLYNGGTEPASVAIELAGNVGEGITITNVTTSQICSFVAQTKADTTDKGRYVVCDGMNGRTVIQNNKGEFVDANLYHNYGFIEVSPGEILGKVSVEASAGRLYCDALPADCIGAHIYADGQWRQIKAIDHSADNCMSVTPEMDADGIFDATIAKLNHIEIKPVSTMELTRLNFVYKPTFA